MKTIPMTLAADIAERERIDHVASLVAPQHRIELARRAYECASRAKSGLAWFRLELLARAL